MKNILLHRNPSQRYVLGGLLSAAALLAFSLSTKAQTAGTLDDNFDADGISNFDFTGDAYGYCIAIDPTSNKVVIGGSVAPSGGDNEFNFVRLNVDGSPDNSFDGNGQKFIDITTGNDVCNAVVIQSNNGILGAGTANNGASGDFALVRLMDDGAPDATFGGGDGIVTTDFGDFDSGQDMAIQSNGRIVVAGFTNDLGEYDFAVARYLSDGTLDNSFSVDGKVTVDFSASEDRATCVAIASDGKIVVGGYRTSASSTYAALLRLNSDGTIDNSFSTDGRFSTYIGATNAPSYGYDLVILDDGSIVLGATVESATNDDFGLLKVSEDGTLDNNFGNGGRVLTTFSSSDAALRSLVHQGYGVIVALGYNLVSSDRDFALARYTPSGGLDNSFSSDGKVTTDLGSSSNDVAFDVAIATVGSEIMLVVCGNSDINGADNDMIAARYYTGQVVGLLELSMTKAIANVYPNPIQESATLSYTLAQAEELTIALQDLQGRVLATYLNGKDMPAGEHTQTITMPSDLASGNYLLVFSSPKGRMSVQVTKAD